MGVRGLKFRGVSCRTQGSDLQLHGPALGGAPRSWELCAGGHGVELRAAPSHDTTRSPSRADMSCQCTAAAAVLSRNGKPGSHSPSLCLIVHSAVIKNAILSEKAETEALKVALELKGLYYNMASRLKHCLRVSALVGLRQDKLEWSVRLQLLYNRLSHPPSGLEPSGLTPSGQLIQTSK